MTYEYNIYVKLLIVILLFVITNFTWNRIRIRIRNIRLSKDYKLFIFFLYFFPLFFILLLFSFKHEILIAFFPLTLKDIKKNYFEIIQKISKDDNIEKYNYRKDPLYIIHPLPVDDFCSKFFTFLEKQEIIKLKIWIRPNLKTYMDVHHPVFLELFKSYYDLEFLKKLILMSDQFSGGIPEIKMDFEDYFGEFSYQPLCFNDFLIICQRNNIPISRVPLKISQKYNNDLKFLYYNRKKNFRKYFSGRDHSVFFYTCYLLDLKTRIYQMYSYI